MPFLIILNLRFSLSYIQPSLCHFILSTISFDSLLLPPSLPIEEIHFAASKVILRTIPPVISNAPPLFFVQVFVPSCPQRPEL
ncbi:hypothetical protein ERO13_A03G116900v2 [Gossypium hirsutum]|uniref:Uncharacterized protein n=1 Tax=Gossypium darwinii TaxID=34276 RepID=A0A5D2H6K0_GOSDA|nr:hypothetical protein ERO13_A03G116900v2 [Gossypium hirsutum]TYH25119.1 hypothetical protein ES288_A03G143800v1 [Gossypium darwinii]